MIHHSRHQNIPELKKRFPSHPANLREAKQEIFSTAATSYLMLPAVLKSRKPKTHQACLHLILAIYVPSSNIQTTPSHMHHDGISL
jgi:hypothetical protein